MRLYWEVARRGFSRWATYRAATVAGVFTNTVFGFVRAYVLLAVYRHRTEIGGFDQTDAVTFVFLTQGIGVVVAIFMWMEIADRVTTGDVVTDLYRPVDFQAYWLAQDLGRAAYHTLTRGVPPVLLGWLVFDLRFTDDLWLWAAFFLAVWLAVVVSFGVRFLVNLTAFWLLDIRGPHQTVIAIWTFLSGFLLPITFFPSWLEAVARVSPFAAMVQLPVELALGQHRGAGVLGVLALQLGWVVALTMAGRATLRAATRKVVVQGG